MPSAREAAAAAILGTVIPFAVGSAADPYNRDGRLVAWARGAVVCGTAAAVFWAADTLRRAG
jgi:hypothetical protein